LKESVFTSERTPQPVDIQPEDDLSILYTSGSTGAPKGAVSTQRGTITGLMGYACHGLAIRQLDGVALESVQPAVLLTVPLFHVTGLIPVCLISFFIGRKLVMMHKWDAGDALALMEQEKVTYFVGVPTMSLELMQHPERDNYDLSVLEDIAAGGAARPADHVARLKQTFPQARPGLGYGLTETNALGCINTRASYIAKPGSTGVVSRPAVELKIADEEGVALQTGEIGEVCLKSAANVRGYWNRPDETAAAFTEDGWFKTGDLGRLDEDGYLFIVDRKKDIIIRGGENISCLEVEDALFNHPKVAEACVFGLPDERLGEMVAAVIMPVDGADLSAEDMQAYVAEHLARFKVPQHIWIATKSLPRLATGKFDKRRLKAAYADILQAS
ncbi:MAG: fatty acid--CoA ligase family protein, partial [Pseudomonadota bacterium]